MKFNLKRIPFKQARNFTPGRIRPVQLIVLHSMEAPEKGNTAENVASYFAGSNAPKASAHFNVDDNSIVQSVRVEDTAWHCKNANANGIGIEHAGYAKQTGDQWLDDYGRAMLEQSAELVAALCNQFKIPMRRAKFAGKNNPQVVETGICGHADVPLHGSHWDPGMGFPWSYYLDRVQFYFNSESLASSRDTIQDSVAVADSPKPANSLEAAQDAPLFAVAESSFDTANAQPTPIEATQQSIAEGATGTQTIINPVAPQAVVAPIVSQPGDTPVQATSGGFKSAVTSAVGWLTGAGAGVIALFKDNTTLLIIAAVILVIAGLAYFIRQLILDRDRLRIAADPTKFNAK